MGFDVGQGRALLSGHPVQGRQLVMHGGDDLRPGHRHAGLSCGRGAALDRPLDGADLGEPVAGRRHRARRLWSGRLGGAGAGRAGGPQRRGRDRLLRRRSAGLRRRLATHA